MSALARKPVAVAARRERRALSHVGGTIEVHCDNAGLAATLRHALDVSSDERRVLAHVHGLHGYPARMHPDTASALIAALSEAGDRVLDPFCGSGTVLVAARLLGRRAFGSDVSPLAVELARQKTRGATSAEAERLVAAAEEIAEHALERQTAKLGPTRPYANDDRALFATHILLELDGLRDGIDRLRDAPVTRALRLAHSAMLGKFAKRASADTRRFPRGFAIRFFVEKAREFAERLLEFSEAVPAGAPVPRVELADARRLEYVPKGTASLVVTSPPYPGVYDYLDEQRTAMRWLRLDARRLEAGEIGARRAASLAEWRRDFGRVCQELARVLAPRGVGALLLGDSTVRGRALHVDDWLPSLLQDAGLELLGRAAQRRPHFHGPSAAAFEARPRREHLVLFGQRRRA